MSGRIYRLRQSVRAVIGALRRYVAAAATWAISPDRMRIWIFFGGLGALTYGINLVHTPAAFVTCGLVLMFIADRGELVRLVGLLRLRVPLSQTEDANE